VSSLNEQFITAAKAVQTEFRNLDKSKTDIFVNERFRLTKLLALLGDRYRADARFPMDRIKTPDLSFLRALYADYATYQYRDKAATWGDLGNFSRTDYSHVTPGSHHVVLESKQSFMSTGAYALPGQVVSVTRMDNSEVSVSVFVNSIRDGATHIFADDGYKRPRFLRGQSMPIEAGESIQFNSSTGGPIQLSFDQNGHEVELRFDNIGQHPHWRSSDDDLSFDARLASDHFDWAEIASPSFEVHSTRTRMLDSIQDDALAERKGSAQALVDATVQYVHNYPHVLAGFQG